mmetsp:Transcript_509/g.2017  ORF Transcript_509/g.2017 Transcript_509/m.2017 type:complete len:86 (-) Transcript_509:2668-2925(-)
MESESRDAFLVEKDTSLGRSGVTKSATETPLSSASALAWQSGDAAQNPFPNRFGWYFFIDGPWLFIDGLYLFIDGPYLFIAAPKS